MKDAAKINDRVEDVFNGLLLGLPPGILSGFVWLAYSVWMFLTHRKSLIANALKDSLATD
jgi:hypothetical protein